MDEDGESDEAQGRDDGQRDGLGGRPVRVGLDVRPRIRRVGSLPAHVLHGRKGEFMDPMREKRGDGDLGLSVVLMVLYFINDLLTCCYRITIA